LWLVTGALLVVRLWLDSHLELMFDEAYYALWAKHLAWSYFDHPPMVALWIRLSTLLFGEHELGVRALGTLSAAAGTGIIYLISWHLFGNRQAAIFAALLYCAMLLISAGAIIITPDTPLLLFWSIALYALARIYEDGRAGWWWVVGVAMGLALQSKYTALLLGAGIVCAMAVVPSLRHWWRSPIPYLAGALSLAMFAPVVLWNYHHGWASFALQFGRAEVGGLSLRFIFELLGSQIGLLTPCVFVLAMAGLWLGLRPGDDHRDDAIVLLVALVGPLLAYFLFHSLHARVHGNWTAPAYPVFAVLGAEAVFGPHKFHPRLQRAIAWSRRWAVPSGLAFAAITYMQVAAAPIPLNPAQDPTALMAGWAELTEQVEAAARKEHASYILTSHYVLTSELGYYSSGTIPIVQYNERIRWLSFDDPPPELLEQRALYVVEAERDEASKLAPRFQEFAKVGEIARTRGGRTITRYIIYTAAKPAQPVLDR
jgi:4-amino-4-deoxy-L-arabinose transferase-like glycosyltransferase